MAKRSLPWTEPDQILLASSCVVMAGTGGNGARRAGSLIVAKATRRVGGRAGIRQPPETLEIRRGITLVSRRGRSGALFVALLIVTMVVAACGGATTGQNPSGSEPTSEPSQPTQVTIAQTTAPSGDFNPLVTQSAYDTDITGLIFDGLLRYKPDLTFEPNLADYSLEDNGLTLAFTLKDGIKFHDGNTLSTKDVAATFYFIMDPNYPGPQQSNYAPLKGAQAYLDQLNALREKLHPSSSDTKPSLTQDQFDTQAAQLFEQWKNGGAIEVVDDKTIKFHFDHIFAPALQAIGLTPIFEASQLASITDIANAATADASTHPIGTGPYKFVQYQTGQFTELEANPDYFRGAPKVDKIIFKVVNQDAMVGLMQNGDVDAVGVGSSDINPQDQPLFAKMDNVYSWENPQFGYQFMFFNLDDPRLQDKVVRQAIATAIDRKGIVDQLLQGHGQVINAPWAPPQWAYPKSGINTYDFNPDQAKQMLADDGWKAGSDGILWKDLNKNGKEDANEKMSFTLKYPGGTSNPIRQASAPLIQANLKAIGFEIKLSAEDFNQYIDEITHTPGKKASFDMGLLGWSLTVDPDLTGLFAETDPYNFPDWSSKTVGADYQKSMDLIKQGLETFDQNERIQIYQELGKIFNDELPYVFLYSQTNITDFNKRVQNVNQDIRGATDNVFEWTVQ